MGCSNSTEVVYSDLSPKCHNPDVSFREGIQVINGSNRNVASWLPTEGTRIKAVVIVCHGLSEHILRYYGISIELAKRGFAVYGMDHVSHGKSDGRRAVVSDYHILTSDFIAFGNGMKTLHPELPVFLLAHSMGTLVGMASINHIANLKAVVLSGTAVFSGPAASSPFGIRCLYPLSQTSVAVCLTSCTSVLDPAGPAAPLVVTEICSDAEELELIKHDPRMNPPVVTNKTAYELVKLINDVKQEIPNIKVPFMCMHGANDIICLPKSSQYVLDQSGTDPALKSVHFIKDAKHEPFHESPEIRTAAVELVVNYFEEQLLQVVVGAKGTVTVTAADDENEAKEGAVIGTGAYAKVSTFEVEK